MKPVCDSYNFRHLRQVRVFYYNYIHEKFGQKAKRNERLYISRHFANRRKIINEDEILEILKKYNFDIFYPEKHSILEQVSIFAEAKYVVAMHGSGLTNILFMKDRCSVLELHKKNTNELNYPSPLFWYMAAGLNINYYHQLCDTYGKEDYFVGDYIVNASLFEKNLNKMLTG